MQNTEFTKEMEEKSGERVSTCYQCYRCTNGCPALAEMDLYPHRLIRHIMLGDREKVLGSKTIWSCLQCYTCSIRCPNDIDIAHIINTARKISTAEGKEKDRVAPVASVDQLPQSDRMLSGSELERPMRVTIQLDVLNFRKK